MPQTTRWTIQPGNYRKYYLHPTGRVFVRKDKGARTLYAACAGDTRQTPFTTARILGSGSLAEAKQLCEKWLADQATSGGAQAESITLQSLFDDNDFMACPHVDDPSNEPLVDPSTVVIADHAIMIPFTYPLRQLVSWLYTSDTGFTRRRLYECICAGYAQIYAEPKAFGVYGHDIGNLIIEGCRYENGVVHLSMGS